MDKYSHAQIVHYTMEKELLRKGLNKYKNFGEAALEKELNQLHMKITFAPRNIAKTNEK